MALQMIPESNEDHYKVLGVKPDSALSDIRSSYLALALQFHPDKGGNGLMFSKIQKAWEVLREADSRRAYDEKRSDQCEIFLDDFVAIFYHFSQFVHSQWCD